MKSKSILLKKSCLYSYVVITLISTVTGIIGYTIRDLACNIPWWLCCIILIGIFLLLSFFIYLMLLVKSKNKLSLTINGINVGVSCLDIFDAKGLKVIPFNERFDTKVDDIIISHDSLNGQMIDKNKTQLKEIKRAISNARTNPSTLLPSKVDNKYVYPLGRIIKYEEYLMLSSSHFDDQNRAYISIHEYETLLSNMWDELRRVYAGKRIILPLIGSGITTINGVQEKNNTMLLKCILCTLRRSRFQPTKGIEIVLTKEAMKKTNLVYLKEEFKNDVQN